MCAASTDRRAIALLAALIGTQTARDRPSPRDRRPLRRPARRRAPRLSAATPIRVGGHRSPRRGRARPPSVVRDMGAASPRAIEPTWPDPAPVGRPAVGDPHVLGPLVGAGVERAVPPNLAKGQTGLCRRVRPADPDRATTPTTPLARGEVGKVGVPVPHLGEMRTLFDGIPLERDEHVDDDQRDARCGCSRMYVALADEQGVARERARGHDPERHREGVPLARHVHLRARGESAAHRRRHHLHGDARARRGTRSTSARTTCRRRARRRCRSSRTGSRPRSACSTRCATRARSPRTSSRRSSAASRSSSTRASASSRRCARCARSPQLWDRICLERYGVDRREAAPLPLRRAGELARAHRGAAREQRAADRARDARRDAVAATRAPARSSCRAGTRRSACPRRGTSSGRCGCSRCSRTRPTCSSTATSSTARRSSRRRSPSSCAAASDELQWVLDGGGAFEMIDADQGPARAVERRAGAPHRVGRAARSSA